MYSHIRSISRFVCSALLVLACAFPLMSKAAQAQDVLTFTAVSHNFGSVAPNSPAINFGIKVTNSSATTDYLNFNVVLAGQTADYTTANNCGNDIAPGASCELLFIFTAGGTAGTQTATWHLTGTGDPTFSYSPTLPGTLSATVLTQAGLTLTTNAHNFGSQLAFTTGPIYGVVLTNSTQHPVALSISLTPSGYQNFPFLHSAYTCPSTLAAGQSCNLQWQFFPSAGNGSTGQPTAFQAMFGISGVDTVTGQAVILTALGNQVSGVTLTGYGITGSNYVLLSTAKHNFGNVFNGSPSSVYGVQMINTRPGPVTVTVSSTGSTGAFPITSDNCFTPPSGTTTLASGQSCQVQFQFSPSAVGVQTATYNLTATSGGSSVIILDQSTSNQVTGVTLTGTSVGAVLQLQSGGHNFGPWVVGTTSSTYGTVLSYPQCTGPSSCTGPFNPINLTYGYSSGSNTSDFNLVVNTCGPQLTYKSSCNLGWTFSPQTAGALSAVYNITGTDSVTGQPVNLTAGGAIVQGVSLSGNGQAAAQLAITTSTHNFGEQGVGGTSATFGTVLYNTTGSSVNLSFGYSNPGEAANFPLAAVGMFTGNNCPAVLPNNGSCNIQFKFTPQAPGPLGVVYNITATSFGTPVTIIDLSTGNPASPPGISLSGTGVN